MKLNEGQRRLYAVVCKRLAIGLPLRPIDYGPVYVGWVRRSPTYVREITNGTTGETRRVERMWTHDETVQQAATWAIRTLGVLVQKGALKVVPQIVLSTSMSNNGDSWALGPKKPPKLEGVSEPLR